MIKKRNNEQVEFDEQKIVNAILRAMKFGSGIVEESIAYEIAYEIKERYLCGDIDAQSVEGIEKIVYERLIEKGATMTAKSYEGYRAVQSFKRKSNTSDDEILGLINLTNKDVLEENSNKNSKIAATQRDLIAGEVSKDIARRKIIPAHIVQAHDECAIHYHDADYAISPIFNCCLINLEDMLDNGTVINEKMVETPKSFETACTVATQIIAQVASNQYGK